MSGILHLSPRLINKKHAGLILLFFGWGCVPCAGLSLPPAVRQAASLAIEKMIASDYNGAILFCDSVTKTDPENPLWPMLRLSAVGLHDLDLDSATDSLNFSEGYKKTEASIFNFEKKFGVSSFSYTINGFSKAIAAAYFLWRKKYFTGLDVGFSALSALKEAKRLDHTNTDVDFILGFYTYARADLKKNFWWAFFWYSGEKMDGIKSIKTCSRNAQFVGLAATLLLAELYYRENYIFESDAITKGLLAEHPESRLTWWTCAKRGEATRSFAEAAGYYTKLADAYDGIHCARRNALATRVSAALMYFTAGDTVQARNACEKILSRKMEQCDGLCKKARSDAEKLLAQMRSPR